ncbi:MAG: hypothetical protein MUC47_09155 [Candidatus Kapabacteria bacterium]|jgi:hypothetical protein|nr:hypothetical protein [Candidatus Kapabacteria bacterium]
MKLYRTIVIALLTILTVVGTFLQASAQSTLMLSTPRRVTPIEYITGDTISYGGATVPGDGQVRYSPLQDSLFRQALALKLTASQRFEYDCRRLRPLIDAVKTTVRDPSAAELAMRTMAIPPEIYAPSQHEIAQRQIAIANSMYVPGVLQFPMGTGNLQIALRDIAGFFGMTEDVSPTIRYSVDVPSNVEVVIYSTQAKVIATIFSGHQTPGTYDISWNGRDEQGKFASNGDYVVEVRIGMARIVRKRIVVPFE